MNLPCPIKDLAQAFIDAQTLLQDTNEEHGIQPDKSNEFREDLKDRLLVKNPGQLMICDEPFLDCSVLYRATNSPLCTLAGDQLVFNVRGLTEYRVPLADCNTLQKIVSWVSHLLEKNWITPRALSEFISLACGHHGIPSRGMAEFA